MAASCVRGLGINMFEITQVGWKDTDREHGAVTANMCDSGWNSTAESLRQGVSEHNTNVSLQSKILFHKVFLMEQRSIS